MIANSSYSLRTPSPTPTRAILGAAFVFTLGLALIFFTLFIGEDVANNLQGIWQLIIGEADKYQSIVVWQWRASRLFSALIIGAALGISGAVFFHRRTHCYRPIW